MTAPSVKDAPTGELGRPGNIRQTWALSAPNRWEIDPGDPNLDLRFPRNVAIYDLMRIDEQVAALLAAVTLPILDAGWDLDTKGVKANVEKLVRAELGLPKPGEPQQQRRRGQAGIVWRDHLREALQCFTYGFMAFEQVATVTNPGDPGHPAGFDDRAVVHLQKLAQRLPSTIRRIEVAPDGGMTGVVQAPYRNGWQWGSNLTYSTDGTDDVTIPVEKLVVYSLDREGGDWSGRSVLRACYRPWKIKDQLIRIDAQAAERQGMGLPVYQRGENSNLSDAAALDMIANVRAGATAGMVVPAGDSVQLLGITGTVVDITSKIQYHDQAITRSGLAMFMDLGHDNGARSLGDTFVDVFTQALTARAQFIAQVATEHIVRDLVEWNFGPDEPYPSLVPGDLNAESALTPEQLKVLADGGLITPDKDLEADLRDRWHLPEAMEEEEPDPAPAGLQPVPGLPDEAVPASDQPGGQMPLADLPVAGKPTPLPVPRAQPRPVAASAGSLGDYANSLVFRAQRWAAGVRGR